MWVVYNNGVLSWETYKQEDVIRTIIQNDEIYYMSMFCTYKVRLPDSVMWVRKEIYEST